MQLVMRSMTALDVDDCLSLDYAAGLALLTRPEFIKFTKRKRAVGTLATDGPRVVAYAAMEAIGAAVHIRSICVHESLRLHGVGRQIVMEAASFFQQKSFVAKVPVDNVAAWRFCVAMGFVELEASNSPTSLKIMIARRP